MRCKVYTEVQLLGCNGVGLGRWSKETYCLHLLGTHPDNLHCNQMIVATTVVECTTVIQITFLHYLKRTFLPSYRVPPKSGQYKFQCVKEN